MDEPLNETRILSPSDICTLLHIKESTLRKYAKLLKDAGYHFDENERGQRAYYEKDILAFKKLIEVKSVTAMTLDQSVNAVMTWLEQSDMSVRAMGNTREIEIYREDMDELKGIVRQQNELIQELLKRMDQQQNHIDERDRKLMESIRQMQEDRKQQLQLAAAQAEKNINWWQRLFK